jgi:hypothetical protein
MNHTPIFQIEKIYNKTGLVIQIFGNDTSSENEFQSLKWNTRSLTRQIMEFGGGCGFGNGHFFPLWPWVG